MNCHICQHDTSLIFQTQVLNKYNVQYFKCNHCGFIQTETPYWLPEAYENAITSLDIGLINRNLYLSGIIPQIIDRCFPEAENMLDYGGGYGMFVRMMRDKGYPFLRYDIYCENLFSKHFDITDKPDTTIAIVTAFEVFEHLADPLAEIEKMFNYAPTIIFSTVLAPENTDEFKNWWYVSPLTGQHVAFYSRRALECIAKKFNKKVYSNGINLHILTDKALSTKDMDAAFGIYHPSYFERLKRVLSGKAGPAAERQSLLEKDYAFIEKKLTTNS